MLGSIFVVASPVQAANPITSQQNSHNTLTLKLDYTYGNTHSYSSLFLLKFAPLTSGINCGDMAAAAFWSSEQKVGDDTFNTNNDTFTYTYTVTLPPNTDRVCIKMIWRDTGNHLVSLYDGGYISIDNTAPIISIDRTTSNGVATFSATANESVHNWRYVIGPLNLSRTKCVSPVRTGLGQSFEIRRYQSAAFEGALYLFSCLGRCRTSQSQFQTPYQFASTGYCTAAMSAQLSAANAANSYS